MGRRRGPAVSLRRARTLLAPASSPGSSVRRALRGPDRRSLRERTRAHVRGLLATPELRHPAARGSRGDGPLELVTDAIEPGVRFGAGLALRGRHLPAAGGADDPRSVGR